MRSASPLGCFAPSRNGWSPSRVRWDAWLQVQADQAPPLTLNWPTHRDQTLTLTIPPGTQWVAVTLTLVAAAPLADALQQHLDTVSAV